MADPETNDGLTQVSPPPEVGITREVHIFEAPGNGSARVDIYHQEGFTRFEVNGVTPAIEGSEHREASPGTRFRVEGKVDDYAQLPDFPCRLAALFLLHDNIADVRPRPAIRSASHVWPGTFTGIQMHAYRALQEQFGWVAE